MSKLLKISNLGNNAKNMENVDKSEINKSINWGSETIWHSFSKIYPNKIFTFYGKNCQNWNVWVVLKTFTILKMSKLHYLKPPVSVLICKKFRKSKKMWKIRKLNSAKGAQNVEIIVNLKWYKVKGNSKCVKWKFWSCHKCEINLENMKTSVMESIQTT